MVKNTLTHDVVIVVQARTGSTRLPGKVLMELVPGCSILSHLLQRLLKSTTANRIVVATTDMPNDDAICAIARDLGILVHRGSEVDVLGRFLCAALEFNAQTIIRVCADSPFLDAEVLDECVSAFIRDRGKLDFVSNMCPESYPHGMAVEVLPLDTLMRLDRITLSMAEREHVTSGVYKSPDLFRTRNIELQHDYSNLRFVVDYAEDLEFAKAVCRELASEGPTFNWRRIVDLLESMPQLKDINRVRNERLLKSPPHENVPRP